MVHQIHERDERKIASLVFDGLVIHKDDVEEGKDELLKGCLDEIKKTIGFDIGIVKKLVDKKHQNHKVTYFCIAKTEENYISFTKIVVDRFSKIEKDGEVKSIDM